MEEVMLTIIKGTKRAEIKGAYLTKPGLVEVPATEFFKAMGCKKDEELTPADILALAPIVERPKDEVFNRQGASLVQHVEVGSTPRVVYFHAPPVR
jgi:malate synthase